MKKLFIILRDRWRAKTPLIFSRIIKIAMGIGMTAAAIQAELIRTGAETPDWWVIYSHIWWVLVLVPVRLQSSRSSMTRTTNQ